MTDRVTERGTKTKTAGDMNRRRQVSRDGRDIWEGTQGVSMLAWRTASLLRGDFSCCVNPQMMRGNGREADE